MTVQAQTEPAGSQVIEFSKLENKYRMLKEDFASPDECRELLTFAEEHGIIGDGYGGNAHPHTPNETFGGYSFDIGKGDPSLPGHQLGLRLLMRARRQMMRHFRLPFLWLDYAHLVFREATGTGEAHETEELSHPWHYDNQSEGIKHRTHTAIMYLNDEFDGGLTYFKEADFGPFRELQPTPGKLIAFRVAENAHAVSKLKSGKRFVLNMWFSTHLKKWGKHRRIFRHMKK